MIKKIIKEILNCFVTLQKNNKVPKRGYLLKEFKDTSIYTLCEQGYDYSTIIEDNRSQIMAFDLWNKALKEWRSIVNNEKLHDGTGDILNLLYELITTYGLMPKEQDIDSIINSHKESWKTGKIKYQIDAILTGIEPENNKVSIYEGITLFKVNDDVKNNFFNENALDFSLIHNVNVGGLRYGHSLISIDNFFERSERKHVCPISILEKVIWAIRFSLADPQIGVIAFRDRYKPILPSASGSIMNLPTDTMAVHIASTKKVYKSESIKEFNNIYKVVLWYRNS